MGTPEILTDKQFAARGEYGRRHSDLNYEVHGKCKESLFCPWAPLKAVNFVLKCNICISGQVNTKKRRLLTEDAKSYCLEGTLVVRASRKNLVKSSKSGKIVCPLASLMNFWT